MQVEDGSGIVTQPAVAGELRELVARAQGGDPSVLPRVRELLEAHPEVVEYVGDVTRLAESVWIELVAAGSPVAMEAVKRQAERLRSELRGARPSTLEKLLVDQVVANWLEMSYTRCAAAQTGGSLAQAALRLRRSEVAQRKYLAAVKALTQTRALLPQEAGSDGAIRLFAPEGERAPA
jgi:hypothetical protein